MIRAEFYGGPGDETTIDRAAAYWSPEPFALLIVESRVPGGRVLAHVWAEREPDAREWAFRDDVVAAHLYKLKDARGRDEETRARIARYEHVEEFRGA